MSNFACIGLAVGDQDQFGALIDRLIAAAVEETSSKTTRHLRWIDPKSGASVAFHVEGDTLSCVTPFFSPPAGLARNRVRTTQPTDDPECIHCGGADCDLLDAGGEMMTRATVQWLHFQPCREWLAGERSFELEAVAFAHRAGFYLDEAAFDAAQADLWGDAKSADDKPLRFASVSFMPEGMFAPDGAPMSQRATALFAGRVESATRLENSLTEDPFWHLRVATLPGALDVVVDAATVEGDPAPGRIALLRAWLVGRPAPPPPSDSRAECEVHT